MSKSPKYKVGVYGSSAGDLAAMLPRAAELGRILGEYADSIIIITGACPGLPYAAAQAAAAKGVEVWGFSPLVNAVSHRQEYPDDDLSIYKKLVYVPKDFPCADNDQACKKYRNVISTATCDAAIIISGRWGSLNEFTNLIDMQKTVGVLTGTGGIADELPALSRKVSKPDQGELLFDDDPEQLVEKLLSSLGFAKRL
jgi:predicted Rossmann-fold nucleotide-binding protein